jgi:hypothetical protein
MTGFNSRPTTTYLATVNALEKLLRDESADSVERAAAEVLRDVRQKQVERRGLKHSPATPCLARILGSRACPHSYYHPQWTIPHEPPGRDHSELLKETDGSYCYHYQPYQLSWENMQELVDLCRKHSLRADIDAGTSWWFPSRTISILIKATNKNSSIL